MNVNKININQSEPSYDIISDAYDITYEESNVGEKLSELESGVSHEKVKEHIYVMVDKHKNVIDSIVGNERIHNIKNKFTQGIESPELAALEQNVNVLEQGVETKGKDIELIKLKLFEMLNDKHFKYVLIDNNYNIINGIKDDEELHYLPMKLESLKIENSQLKNTLSGNCLYAIVDSNNTIIASIDINGKFILNDLSVSGNITRTKQTNKKFVFIGDSITYGDTLTDDERKYRWSSIVSRAFGATEINLGVNGTCLEKLPNKTNSFIERVDANSSQIEDADIIFVFGGVNDFVLSTKPLGGVTVEGTVPPEYSSIWIGQKYLYPTDDEFTFDGAYNVLINKLRTIAPTALIVLITPMHRRITYVSSMGNIPSDRCANVKGNYLSEYIKVIQDIGDFYSLPIVNLYSDSNLNTQFEGIDNKYFTDGTHPNVLGHEVIANIVINKINNFLSV